MPTKRNARTAAAKRRSRTRSKARDNKNMSHNSDTVPLKHLQECMHCKERFDRVFFWDDESGGLSELCKSCLNALRCGAYHQRVICTELDCPYCTLPEHSESNCTCYYCYYLGLYGLLDRTRHPITRLRNKVLKSATNGGFPF